MRVVHVERGILFGADTPPALIEVEERTVRRIVADRRAPSEELDRLIRTAIQAYVDITASTVVDWFDISDEIAAHALTLAVDRARSRHPALTRSRRRAA